MARRGTMLSNMNLNTVSKYDLSIHAYLRIFVMKSVSLSCVENPGFRHLAQYKDHIFHRIFTAALFELVKLMEDQVKF